MSMSRTPNTVSEFHLGHAAYAKLRDAILAEMEKAGVPFILFDHLAKAISSDLEAARVFGPEEQVISGPGLAEPLAGA
jgi:hypothetical protein